MNNIYVEFCQGHSLKGVQDSYFLPQPDSNGVYLDILEGHDKSPGYLDAIDYLTINEENRLRRKVQQLTVRSLRYYFACMWCNNDKLEALQNEFQELKEKLGL